MRLANFNKVLNYFRFLNPNKEDCFLKCLESLDFKIGS